ncbi:MULTISPECIES: STM4504/CBY_0614 family protein [unclassified Cedecea]|uniref:STM4504/CBY_0614 family protein n=1 Tax=unclassified Cedecea TaxID=2649846 RepID=UPI0030196FF9
MAIFELFSKRQKKLRGEVPDIYQYTKISNSFRVQVIHIVRDTIGEDVGYGEGSGLYKLIHQTLCKEYGVFSLKERARNNFEAIYESFLNENNYENCLDVIEISFKLIDGYVRNNEWKFRGNKQQPEDAIDELNIRFKESGLGYQFESGELIRVDSQFLHSEAVKPTLQLLGKQSDYIGSNDEFLSAHEHYRHQRYKECLNDCLKSFESLMKAIHRRNKWQFNDTDTAKKLINSCLSNNLVPEYLQNQFSSIRILLESGIPTIRNKEGGHGQGSEVTTVPEYLASYTLHLTATNLLFLAKCEENYNK